MKKKGSALMITMILLLSLMIIGMAISSAVVSTLKYNKRHSEVIDLELAAKSGLNIFREDLLNSINKSIGINNLPVSFPKDKSDIVDFEGITIYKEIIRNEKREDENLVGYDYIIISTAVDDKSKIEKDQKQVISVSVNSGSGEIDKVEINPEGVLNVKGSVEWINNTFDFLKYTSYGDNLKLDTDNKKHKGQLGEYIRDNNINKSEEMGKVDFDIINNVADNIDIGDFEVTQKNFSGLKEVTLQYLIDNNSNTINENIILNGDLNLGLSQNYIGEYNLNLNNATLVVDGSFISNSNLNINLINNSNLIINGDLNISQNGDIKVNGSSFIDIKGGLVVKNGVLKSHINENSIINIGKSIQANSNGIELILENSKLDVGFNIESNGLDIKINNSDFIIRNGGIFSTANYFKLEGDNNRILINGDLIGNEIYIKIGKKTKLIANKLKSTSGIHKVSLKLYESKCLFNNGVEANDVEIYNYGSDLIFLENTYIRSFNNYNENGVIIFGGTYKGHTVTIELNNSIVFILPSSDSNVKGMELENLLKVNNIRKGAIYILGNLKAHTINVYGDKDSKSTSDIIKRAEGLLTK